MSLSIPDYFSPLIQEIKKTDAHLLESISKHLSKTYERALQTFKSNLNQHIKNSKIEEHVLKDKIKTTSSKQKELLNKLSEVNMQLSSLKDAYNSKEKDMKLNNSNNAEVSQNFKELIEKIQREKDALMKKKEKIEKKIALKEELKNKEIKETEESKRLEKKKKIKERIKEFKSKQEAQRNELLEKEADYKSRIPSEKLFSKLKKEYNALRRSEEIQRKEKLKEIHNFHKPINNKDLLDFENKFLQNLEEKDKARYNKFTKLKLELKERQKEIKEKFSSNTLKKLEAFRREELQKELEKDVNLINKVLKHKEFFEKVKKYHAPKTDKNKVLEIEYLKQENNLANNFSKHYMSEGDIENEEKADSYEIGMQYLRNLNKNAKKKQQIQKDITSTKSLQEKNPENLEENAQKNSEKIRKTEGNAAEKPCKSVEISITKPSNYLNEIKEKYNLFKKPDYWKKIEKNRDLNSMEKLEKLRQEAEEMEKKAKRKEQVLKLKRKKNNFDVGLETQNQDIDDLLMNSIQAKIKLLGD